MPRLHALRFTFSERVAASVSVDVDEGVGVDTRAVPLVINAGRPNHEGV